MTETSQKPSNWNLPNLLTSLRIVMVPFFGWALLVDGGESATWRTIAYAIFAVAMITDKIDGDIARARNLVTDFGKIADPIADKAITGMAFIGLAVVGDIWWWGPARGAADARRGAVLRLAGAAGGRRRADAVVGLGVLPRRLEAAPPAARLTHRSTPSGEGNHPPHHGVLGRRQRQHLTIRPGA